MSTTEHTSPHHRAVLITSTSTSTTSDPSAPRSITLANLPTPPSPPPHGTVLISPLAAPLSANSRKIWTGATKYPLFPPLVPGGNCVARVLAVPADAVTLKPGMLVFFDCTVRGRDDPDAATTLVGIHAGAGEKSLKLGREVWRNGTMAEVASVPVENVHVLDEEKLCGQDGLGYEIADLAKLGQCVTAYGGLGDAGVGPGDTVVVAPATGAFGGAAVNMALGMGCRVVAAGRSGEKLKRLEDGFKNPMLRTVKLVSEIEKDTAALMEAVGPKGAECYIDWMPTSASSTLKSGETPAHIKPCISAVRPRGTVSVMGGIMGDVMLPYGQIMFKNLTVRGTLMYTRPQVVQTIKMLENGNLKLGKGAGVAAARKFPLEDIEGALDAVDETEGGWNKNAVLTPCEW
ncbi:isopropanol dehydrogenase [Saccharata proteae CBS 121410]|uniref:Isopropanol dehydrogenase n=1 Tax=Saccharata proteae CBS 121410 TaxID=1314787 RepID=A0A9P4HMZ3_9PEZI|nr:isopropanol dehydrogenase [Saccharata proteae CBS 121410]